MQPLQSSEYLLKRQRKEILERARRIAVVGLRTDPIFKSYGRTQKLIEYGLSILPVIPNCESFLSIPCYERLQDVGGDIDIVQIYPDPGIDLLTLALEAIRQRIKVFWVEDHEAPEPVRKILGDATVYLVECESLEREYRKNCCSPAVAAFPGKMAVSLKVSERMTRNPVTAKRKETVSGVLTKMNEGHFRHLPVVDDSDRLVGMLSDRDLRLIHPSSAFVSCQQIADQLASITVEQAAVFTPVAILYDATLEEAASMMLHWQVGALPVVTGDSRLVGIITYADLLREFLDSRSITRLLATASVTRNDCTRS